MTIVGIGMDATDLPRIAAAIERYGDRFLSRILTDEEQAYVLRVIRRWLSAQATTPMNDNRRLW